MVNRGSLSDAVFLDHVMFVGSDLRQLETAFAGIGLDPRYGGVHAGGITHNSLVTFPDGTYLELLSTVDEGAQHPTRSRYIDANAGPCGWIVEPADIEAVLAKATALELPVSAPEAMGRERDDGSQVEWELASIGEGVRGTKFPTLIADRTPRDLRVPPVTNPRSELTGVGAVVLGVHDLEASEAAFSAVFGLPEPLRDDGQQGMQLSHFPGTPLFLATPRSGSRSWLAQRLTRFGELPCAFLLRTRDLDVTVARRPISSRTSWFDSEIGWFDLPGGFGGRVGAIE